MSFLVEMWKSSRSTTCANFMIIAQTIFELFNCIISWQTHTRDSVALTRFSDKSESSRLKSLFWSGACTALLRSSLLLLFLFLLIMRTFRDFYLECITAIVCKRILNTELSSMVISSSCPIDLLRLFFFYLGSWGRDPNTSSLRRSWVFWSHLGRIPRGIWWRKWKLLDWQWDAAQVDGDWSIYSSRWNAIHF